MNAQSTYFRIVGHDIPSRCLINVKGTTGWISQVGTNDRLADGTRVTFARPQFLDKEAVTINGEAWIAPPFRSMFRFGDTITIDMPDPTSIMTDSASADLEYPPADDYVWWFAYDADGRLVASEHGAAGVVMTMWVPRITIMLDKLSSSYDDAAGRWTWGIEGEIV